jgi:hypothetical protein
MQSKVVLLRESEPAQQIMLLRELMLLLLTAKSRVT